MHKHWYVPKIIAGQLFLVRTSVNVFLVRTSCQKIQEIEKIVPVGKELRSQQ